MRTRPGTTVSSGKKSRPPLASKAICAWLMAVAVLLYWLLHATSMGTAAQAQPATTRNAVLLLHIDDAIGPAISDFFRRGLEHAREERMQLVILELDTPGGLETSMRDMIEAILASPVPVATYVAPSGARAASAGTFLLYASHVAAMAPATHVGAATPVAIGGSRPPPEPTKAPEAEPGADPVPAGASERKAVNDSAAYIRSLAQLRGRNVEWAESAVRNAVSLSANEALEQGVIDLLAADLPDLVRQLDGRELKMPTATVKLQTSGATIEAFEADWRTQLLSWLTNPNIAYFLLLAGIYGLLLEGYNPGAIVPGVVGAVSLVLALYALQMLSVNYAGLALVALGIGLIIAESFVPSFGALGLGGAAALVIGSIVLFDNEVPGFQIARGVIVGIASSAALLTFLTALFFARSRRRPVVTGTEQLLQQTAVAIEDFEHTGFVTIHGETWQAVTQTPVKKGESLRVQRVVGLTLHVTPGP